MKINSRSPRPTMTEIGRLAGVSQSTVSLILNDVRGAKLARATRENVLRIAQELGYPLTRHVQARARQQRNLIVYLTDELSTSPHTMQTIEGAKDGAWDADCLLAVFATRSDPDHERAVLSQMLDNPSLLGVIYSTIFTRAAVLPPALANVPTVLVNCHVRERTHCSVVPGDVMGGFSATMHLIEAGHRRIGFINGEMWLEAASDRLKGYRQALSTAEIPFDPDLVREGNWQVSGGFAHAQSLLSQPQRPTALFCANDLMAVGAMDAARKLKLDVPKKLSIVGYDDQDIAGHTRPPLTTVLLPNYEMGRWAAEALIAQVRSGTGTRRASIKIDCPLVPRGSVSTPA